MLNINVCISTASHDQVDFDFLVRSQFLRSSLSFHMDTEGISTVGPASVTQHQQMFCV